MTIAAPPTMAATEGDPRNVAVAASDSDDEDMERELFGLTSGALAGAAEADEETPQPYERLERLMVEGAEARELLDGGDSDGAVPPRVLALARRLLAGEYAATVLESEVARAVLPPSVPPAGAGGIEWAVRRRVAAYLQRQGDGLDFNGRAFELLCLGAALLNLYLQANYTGPAPGPETLAAVTAALRPVLQVGSVDDENEEAALSLLGADGESAYRRALLPSALVAGRLLLHCLALPGHATWIRPFVLDEEGRPALATATEGDGGEGDSDADDAAVLSTLERAARALGTARIWAARAAVTHRRALPGRRVTTGLWTEASLLMKPVVEELNRRRLRQAVGEEGSDGGGVAAYDDWATRLWLEWGLAQHFFEEADHARQSFQRAQASAGLELTVTARLGRRTKYQERALPQMVLLVKSARPREEQGEQEEGQEGEGGESLPLATVHGADSILLEATRFEKGEEAHASSSAAQPQPQPQPEGEGEGEGEVEGRLHPLEQAVLLALCLDVANSNARGDGDGGLTSEQMAPYVARVLQHPANWMVYSTALLERSWLDFESQYGRERALLQIQALVDQHGTKLTLTQASSDAVERDAAPAQDRLRYVHTVAYPAQWELKRDLAERYAKMGVVASAADLFEELGLWDEVVDCYKVLGRIARAEALVRERLAERETPSMWAALGDLTQGGVIDQSLACTEETPSMWAALGELTQDVACYEKAWAASKGRYPRAKRSLGRVAFREQRFDEALAHFRDAVAIMPLVPDVWFLMGLAHMALEQWEGALQAFTRVVQQEPDEARAWGNIAAVQMKLGDFERALTATKEAVRYLRDNQELWENYLTCAARLGRAADVVQAFHRLIDLRQAAATPQQGQGPRASAQQQQQSQPPQQWAPDARILDLLVRQSIALKENVEKAESAAAAAAAAASDGGGGSSGEVYQALRIAYNSLTKQVAELLGRVTSIITTDPTLWLLYARFNEGAFVPTGEQWRARQDQALDCRTRACRALLSKSGWEKDEARVAQAAEALEGLVDAHLRRPSVAGLSQCELFLKAPLRKLSEEGSAWAGSPEQGRVASCMERLQATLAELKSSR